MAEDCPICAKHRGEGPLFGAEVWAGDLVVITHRPPGEDGRAPLGYVFVETRRHVAALGSLTEAEVTAVARAAWAVARGLRAELGAEHVFSSIIGMAVPHFHQHVFARHPGTPTDLRWTEVHQWPGAPRGDATAAAELCARLRLYF